MVRFYQLMLLFILLFSFSIPSMTNGVATPSQFQYGHGKSVNMPLQQKGYYYGNNLQPKPALIQSPRNLPQFSSINVSDDLDVMVTGGKRQSIILVGDPRAVREILTEVVGKTLYIERMPPQKSSEPYSRKVLVKITTNGPLSGIYTNDTAQVTAKNIQSRGLTLVMEDHSLIRVNAHNAVLRKVENNSTRNFVMSGINSRDLHVVGMGRGELILSGTVGELTARLYGTSCLRAERLKVREAYIHTEDNALAMVSPYWALYAFALGDSNIYYTKTPSHKLVLHSQNTGNVLKVPYPP